MTSLLSSTTAPTMPTGDQSALSGSGALVSEREAPRMYTEREMVLAKREAWARAHAGAQIHDFHDMGPCSTCERARRLAAEFYPLPKVTRPRTPTDPHIRGMRWRVVDDHVLQVADDLSLKGSWRNWPTEGLFKVCITPERVALWADLFATPTETVPEDDSR